MGRIRIWAYAYLVIKNCVSRRNFKTLILINRLKKALKIVYPLLTTEERRRNKRGNDRLYVSVKHSAYCQLVDLYRLGMDKDTEVIMTVTLYYPFINGLICAFFLISSIMKA